MYFITGFCELGPAGAGSQQAAQVSLLLSDRDALVFSADFPVLSLAEAYQFKSCIIIIMIKYKHH